MAIAITRIMVPASPKTTKLLPIQSASPVRVNEAARLRPPPKRSNNPQGSFCITSQFIRYGFSLSPLGRRNKATAAIKAIPASVSCISCGKEFNIGRVIHAKAVIKKTIPTRFSALLIDPSSTRIFDRLS